MSDYGKFIREQLPRTSGLKDDNNDGAKVIDKTIGAWLDNHTSKDFFEQFFLQTATGKYLDLHGRDYGVPRRVDESDDDYRERIVYEVLGHLTVNYLIDVYNVELYTFVEDYNPEDNTLTSDNPFYASEGYMGITDNNTKQILEKKFVINHGVEWI